MKSHLSCYPVLGVLRHNSFFFFLNFFQQVSQTPPKACSQHQPDSWTAWRQAERRFFYSSSSHSSIANLHLFITQRVKVLTRLSFKIWSHVRTNCQDCVKLLYSNFDLGLLCDAVHKWLCMFCFFFTFKWCHNTLYILKTLLRIFPMAALCEVGEMWNQSYRAVEWCVLALSFQFHCLPRSSLWLSGISQAVVLFLYNLRRSLSLFKIFFKKEMYIYRTPLCDCIAWKPSFRNKNLPDLVIIFRRFATYAFGEPSTHGSYAFRARLYFLLFQGSIGSIEPGRPDACDAPSIVWMRNGSSGEKPWVGPLRISETLPLAAERSRTQTWAKPRARATTRRRRPWLRRKNSSTNNR